MRLFTCAVAFVTVESCQFYLYSAFRNTYCGKEKLSQICQEGKNIGRNHTRVLKAFLCASAAERIFLCQQSVCGLNGHCGDQFDHGTSWHSLTDSFEIGGILRL